MKKIFLFLILVNTFLLSDAVKVHTITEKSIYRIIVPLLGNKMSTGTGFFINKDGYLITNNHVIEGNINKFEIKNSLGYYKDIKLIKAYPKHDIAILKVNNYLEKTFLHLQNSSSIKKGLEVFTLGFPGGADMIEGISFNASLSGGLISKLDISISNKYPKNYKFIQIDAVINHGNSGGPLLSRKGTVLGITTLGRGEDTQGIFWAINVEELIKVLDANAIKYTLSSDNIGEVSNSDIQSDFKFIFILVSIIIAILIVSFFLIKRNSNRSVQSSDLSQLVQDKIDKYGVINNFDKGAIDAIVIDYNKEKITLSSKNTKYPSISVAKNKKITVGRSSKNTFKVNNTFISSQHLKIKFIHELLYVKDLNSSNGTYINGKKLTPDKYYLLEINKKLILGSEEVIYKIEV